jgi:hypothetical protein
MVLGLLRAPTGHVVVVVDGGGAYWNAVRNGRAGFEGRKLGYESGYIHTFFENYL